MSWPPAAGRPTTCSSLYTGILKRTRKRTWWNLRQYISEISGWNLGEILGEFLRKNIFTLKNSFNKRLCTITCKAFIYTVLQVKRRFYHKPPFSGLDGSRTRVRNTIPCPSTSVVYYLTFPLPHDNKQPCGFSSFMIRPMAQSFANVVSHIVEAWVLKCECSRSDCCH